jgi:uncharacterized membrane protein YraQ (UPF0718 family)
MISLETISLLSLKTARPKSRQAKIKRFQITKTTHIVSELHLGKIPKHTNIVLLDYLWLQLGFFIKAILKIIVPQETITMFVGQGRLLWRLNLQKWSEPLLF